MKAIHILILYRQSSKTKFLETVKLCKFTRAAVDP